jgi:hypothetical protein
MENNNIIEDLDTSWIEEFEKIDNDYKNYYTEELSFIKIHFIYLNKNNDIEKIHQEKTILKNKGILNKDELYEIIKNNNSINKTRYNLSSILKFIIDIEPIHLKTFLRNNDKNIGNSYLESIKNIDSIKFNKSITLFHDLNNLFIFFTEKNNLNKTKKSVNFDLSIKKTKKKLFKD